ncbi:response regulator transcription factor [Chromatocurvus halotolerans]|nr:response regulator transcription factor [Chromatocurvus halotolerans]
MSSASSCESPSSRTLVIADDHPLFRQALMQVLGERFPGALLRDAEDVAALQGVLDVCGEVDLLLLDLHIPGAVGLSALSWLVGQRPQLPVILISANTHPETVRRAIDHGAAAFLSKSADVDTMVGCMEAVLDGRRGLHPGLEASAEGVDLSGLDTAEALGNLTPQQFRVLNMLAEGLLNKQIAHALEVREVTVKAHITEIFRKLGVHSRTQAVLALGSLVIAPPDALSRPPGA